MRIFGRGHSHIDQRPQGCCPKDIPRFWTATLDYWVRLPKSALLAALPDAPSMADRSGRTREDAIKSHAKLRKDDLAAKIATLFEGANYLPAILVTPVAAGALAVTAEGAAMLAAPAVAAE